ncbi:hypothetical protein JW905_01250 [bacterium]|nr:hypothetical protein [candidate division CSSED10-310 bacterium]
MDKEIKNFVERVINKGDETIKSIGNEIFMSEHFAAAVEKIITTKGFVDRKVKIVLNGMNVATKMDLDEINDRIRKLNRDVARIQKLLSKLEKKLDAEPGDA